MNTLFGRATATLDSKGRISLPAKYRKLLPEEVVIAMAPAIKDENGKEICPSLVIYTVDDYGAFLDAVEQGKGGDDATDLSLQDTMEKLTEYTEFVHVDSVGRIPIPDVLREHARIDKEVVFTGARDHLIVRSQAVWAENAERREKNVQVYKDDSR